MQALVRIKSNTVVQHRASTLREGRLGNDFTLLKPLPERHEVYKKLGPSCCFKLRDLQASMSWVCFSIISFFQFVSIPFVYLFLQIWVFG